MFTHLGISISQIDGIINQHSSKLDGYLHLLTLWRNKDIQRTTEDKGLEHLKEMVAELHDVLKERLERADLVVSVVNTFKFDFIVECEANMEIKE